MPRLDDFPLSETLAVFVGIAGFDWLVDGNAQLFTALSGALVVGLLIFIVRRIRGDRKS